MTRARTNLAGAMLLAIVAAGTTWAATLSWRGFTQTSSSWLLPLLILALVVAATGALARWWRLPGAVAFLLQVLVSAMFACLLLTGSPLPVGPAWSELTRAIGDAWTTAEQYQAPISDRAPSIAPLLILGGLGCMLLVDLLACTLRRVPLAGLPLLAVYSVPVSLLDGRIAWWVFALTAGGFLTLLYLHESEQVARWGRPLGQAGNTDTPPAVRAGAVKTTAGTIGGVATALAVVAPLAIPTLDTNLLDIGRGQGGGGDISITNPMVDLVRDLSRGEDVPLIRIETDDPDPDHLRIAVLTRFTENEWSSGDREVPTQNLPNGAMPALQGVATGVPSRSYDYSVDIGDDFDSTWLPTQAPISDIRADGDWRYDPRTMDFIAGDEETAAGMSYEMTSVGLDLEAADLARAPATVGKDLQEFLEVPDGLPDLVSDLAVGVTDGAASKFEQAQALQRWFREVGGFTYDLDEADDGNGVDELEAFLDADGGRTGYCEQFAAAMAVMARVLDIPARVAVGFLEPDQVGPGTYEYSAHDLHAWPELYFEGAGWVLFEPTPSSRAERVPGYTTQNVPDVENPTFEPSGTASDDVPDRATEGPSASAPVEDELAATGDDDQGTTFPWLPVLGGLALLALLLALALTPRLLRQRVRERRLAGGPEEAWAELRAAATDLGLRWPRARSPRETRDWLVRHLGSPGGAALERPARGPHRAPEAVAALGRIVDRLERMRYARGHDPQRQQDDSLAADVTRCVTALEAGASPRARRTAHWWPRSVLQRDPRTRRTSANRAEPIGGGVVEHVAG